MVPRRSCLLCFVYSRVYHKTSHAPLHQEGAKTDSTPGVGGVCVWHGNGRETGKGRRLFPCEDSGAWDSGAERFMVAKGRKRAMHTYIYFYFIYFFLPIIVSVACPTGPHPPLRLARRPNRGHIGGGGWIPSCCKPTCLRCFYREWVQHFHPRQP